MIAKLQYKKCGGNSASFMKVFLDTNLFLDAMLQNREFKKAPIELLNMCSRGKLMGYTSGISIGTITYFLQKATKSNASDLINAILKYVEVVSLSKEDFLLALTYGFQDLEDAYQCVAAEKAEGIDYIITRNEKDFKESKIPAITAEKFLEIMV